MKQTGLNRGKRQRIVTALDVGTSKICCLIAKTWSAPDWLEVAGEGVQFEVLGFGHHRAEGLKGGMVTHLDRAEHCIRLPSTPPSAWPEPSSRTLTSPSPAAG
jgi:Actin-like ATPase involved in cell division